MGVALSLPLLALPQIAALDRAASTASRLSSTTSRGPDRRDNGGGGDDLVVQVSSRPPGRQTTLQRLEIAQNALNADPAASLTGVWANDLVTLGLSNALANDGWDQPFLINSGSRVVYSAGPDNNHATTGDNLPRGVGP